MQPVINRTPLISVVMPVYNAGAYLAEAIDSILAQTYRHFECIIVDDGSTDGSAAVMQAFAARDRRVRLLSLPHGGNALAFKTGVAAAQGDFIARMDHDDIALPERFAVQLAWMRRTGVDICGSCAKTFGMDDCIVWYPETHAAICHELVFRNGLLFPTVLFRADIAKAYPYNTAVRLVEYEMWTKLALHHRMGNVPQILHKYRCHTQQMSVQYATVLRAQQRRLRQAYFQTLFPEASAEDYAVVARVADREPLSSLPELQRAGVWLVRLAQVDDAYLRNRMAHRWLGACRRSAFLGLDSYRLYLQIAPAFRTALRGQSCELWAICALRLRHGSRLYTALAQLKRAWSQFSHTTRRQAVRKMRPAQHAGALSA